MIKLKEAIRYLVGRYPNRAELSEPRLVKLLFLIDYQSVRGGGQPITGISWVNGYSGPEIASNHEAFMVSNAFVHEKEKERHELFASDTREKKSLWWLRRGHDIAPWNDIGDLSERDKVVIDTVIGNTYHFSWDILSSFLATTEPISGSSYSSTIILHSKEDEQGYCEIVA